MHIWRALLCQAAAALLIYILNCSSCLHVELQAFTLPFEVQKYCEYYTVSLTCLIWHVQLLELALILLILWIWFDVPWWLGGLVGWWFGGLVGCLAKRPGPTADAYPHTHSNTHTADAFDQQRQQQQQQVCQRVAYANAQHKSLRQSCVCVCE